MKMQEECLGARKGRKRAGRGGGACVDAGHGACVDAGHGIE